MDELQRLYGTDAFDRVWRSVSTDIKVRTYRNLGELPEVQVLPSNIQEQFLSLANNVRFNYQTIVDDGMFYNTAYVAVVDQGKENWMGMYQYNYATTLSKAVSLALGLGVCIGGVYYFCTAAAAHVQSVIGFISANYKGLQDAIVKVAGTIFSATTYCAFYHWLTNEYSEWKMLVAACILKKIQSIRGS